MWRCDQCGADGEDHFEVCWRCGVPRDGLDPGPEAPSQEPGPPLPREDETTPAVKRCPACDAELEERGAFLVHTGGSVPSAIFGLWVDQQEKDWRISAWVCPSCRRLAFYEAE